jgi:hypothetical protein
LRTYITPQLGVHQVARDIASYLDVLCPMLHQDLAFTVIGSALGYGRASEHLLAGASAERRRDAVLACISLAIGFHNCDDEHDAARVCIQRKGSSRAAVICMEARILNALGHS